MVETVETGRRDDGLGPVAMNAPEVEAWFVREVLPLEAMLMQYLRHNWRDQSDVEDLRQEVYIRVCQAARKEIPQPAKAFVFTTARNLLIDRARKSNVIPIEAVSDLDSLGVAVDTPGPDRAAIARDELRKLQDALDQLPARQREVMLLGRVEGLTGREIAQRLGLAETTVSEHLAKGMHALTDILLRDSVDLKRRP
jgi:RNA polymerase sigma-70 factor (ECF subfamily)